MQCACAVLYCYMWTVRLWSYFFTLSYKWHKSGKKVLNTKCVFRFCLQFLSEILTPRRIQRDITNKLHRSSRKIPVILVIFWWNFNFLYRFFKNPQIYTFMKICSVWAELFHADRQTDLTKIIVAFRNFANALKNCEKLVSCIPPYPMRWLVF